MQRRPFYFGIDLNLGTKFRAEIELFSVTKLRKNIFPLGICLINKKLMPMWCGTNIISILLRILCQVTSCFITRQALFHQRCLLNLVVKQRLNFSFESSSLLKCCQ